MTLKEQWKKIKDNWMLILVALVVVIVVLSFSGGNTGYTTQSVIRGSLSSMGAAPASAKMESADYGTGGSMPYPSSNFAPDVTQRLITKTASMSNEIGQGKFQDAESTLKNIVTSTDSYMLNENVNAYGEDWERYSVGSYQIKVETPKYSSIIDQLKAIGKVTSFSENAEDITGQYTDMNTELAAEKDRLLRYQQIYSQTNITADKITVSDRIFDEQRTIKYYEDAIRNMDNQVSYSTIYLTMNEKQSSYAGITLAKFGDLARTLVDSFNGLLYLLFAVLPWVAAGLIIWGGVRVIRRKKK